ncbi:hypothetical protein MK489_18325 [Myxococcota bacterium]|nr:hypothetical protein [Myxococcota bacterium]
MSRSFRLRPKREQDSIERQLKDLLSKWRRDWTMEPGLSVKALLEVSPDPSQWSNVRIVTESRDLWCSVRIEDEAELAAALFARPRHELEKEPKGPGTSLTQELVERASIDLAQRILGTRSETDGGAHIGVGSIPDSAFAPGSGVIAVNHPIGDTHITALLSPALADALLKSLSKHPAEGSTPSSTLTPISESLDVQRVRARAIVGTAEIPLDSLATLCAGDVISLDQGISDPSVFEFPDLELSCDAYLCEHEGASVLLLKRPSGAPGESPG